MLKKLFVITLGVSVFLSCGTTAPPKTSEVRDLVEEAVVYEYCPKVESDEMFFRATATEVHQSEEQSRRFALARAKAYIAEAVKIPELRSKIKMYEETQQIGDNSSLKSISESLISYETKVDLIDVKVICDRVIRLPDGRYKRTVSVEMPKPRYLKDLEKQIRELEINTK